jgi:hypothetical protein
MIVAKINPKLKSIIRSPALMGENVVISPSRVAIITTIKPAGGLKYIQKPTLKQKMINS